MMPPAPILPRSQEQARANAEPGPERKPVRGLWPDQYSAVFALLAVIVTVAAIAFAIYAPQRAATAPQGFAKVVDGPITTDQNWSLPTGCSLVADGLHVEGNAGGAACVFQPSDASDLTSQGFWLEVTVAPANIVPGRVNPVVVVGTDIEIGFDDQGAYEICFTGSTGCAQGTASSWHSDSFVRNKIAVRYLRDAQTITVFANGREVVSQSVLIQQQDGIALGAATNASAIFTHIALYTASAPPAD
jgi:hypothetical protein